MRSLIEKVSLTPGPERGEIYATLRGELGTILVRKKKQAIGEAAQTTTPPRRAACVVLWFLVAGVGFEPTTFRL